MEILSLILDLPLHPGNIPAFRAAVVELVGREQLLFHNHESGEGDTSHYRRDYPLIQYRVHRGDASITGLGEGAAAIRQQLLPRLPAQWSFAERRYRVSNYYINTREYNWSLHAEPKTYGLYQWLALSHENYDLWKSAEDGESRRAVLCRALTGHLRLFAKAVNFPRLEDVNGEVLQVHRVKRISWHDTNLIAFDALINSNLGLPAHIGLGRIPAFGFGELLPANVYETWIRKRKKAHKTPADAKA